MTYLVEVCLLGNVCLHLHGYKITRTALKKITHDVNSLKHQVLVMWITMVMDTVVDNTTTQQASQPIMQWCVHVTA